MGNNLSYGARAGIALAACVCVLLLVALIALLWGMRNGRRDSARNGGPVRFVLFPNRNPNGGVGGLGSGGGLRWAGTGSDMRVDNGRDGLPAYQESAGRTKRSGEAARGGRWGWGGKNQDGMAGNG